MKALIYTAPRRLELDELPTPGFGPGKVVVKVGAVGICGSDLDGFLGRSKKRVPPLVLGHEFSGEVVEVGDGVHRIRVGDRVAVYPLIVCERCKYCTSSRPHLCFQRKLFGLDFHGAMAEYVSVPEKNLFPLPSHLGYREGALVEPLANALHVIDQCGDIGDRTGVIYGAGSIGLLVYFAARLRGAKQLALVDRNAKRLERLREFGADLIINPENEDPVKAVRVWTKGAGVEFAVDAVGEPVCRRNVLEITAAAGVSVWIGLGEDFCEVSGRLIVTRELNIKGSYAYTYEDFEQALLLIADGRIPVAEFTQTYSLGQGQEVFEELTTGRSPLLKAIFHPG